MRVVRWTITTEVQKAKEHYAKSRRYKMLTENLPNGAGEMERERRGGKTVVLAEMRRNEMTVDGGG